MGHGLRAGPDGRRPPFRMLVLLDEQTRECLAIEMHRSLGGKYVVAVLDELTATSSVSERVQHALSEGEPW